MAGYEVIAFAQNGEYLASSTSEGRLKIWETSTGVLKQEYTPTSHLSSTCCCLAWGFNKQTAGNGRKKKRRKSEVLVSASELSLLAMGTHSGSILLYSVSKADLQSQMTGHRKKVTAICWNAKNDALYSGSSDQQLIEWSLETGNILRKWKTEKGKGTTAMCLTEDGNTLITGHRTILWWDLKTLQVIKRFTGHATLVKQLLFVCYPQSTETEGRYFLSSAGDDRVINAWQLNAVATNSNALASFILSEQSCLMEISKPIEREQTILLAAITNSGYLNIFEHHLNGRCKAPLKPAVTIMVSSSGFEDKETPKPIPIACVQFCNDDDRNILIAYGNTLHLKFEKIPYSSKEREVILIRKDPSKHDASIPTNSTKVKTPQTNSDVRILGPVHLTSAPASTSKAKGKLPIPELPMEERLNVMTLEQSNSEPPRVSNLTQLLLQGLQSQDKEILSSVLSNDDDNVIVSTVERLPIQALVPLMKELQDRILNTSSPLHKLLKWIRCIFTKHASYLVTVPDLDSLLGPLHQIFIARTHLFEKVSRLRGRLDLVKAQLATNKRNTTSNVSQEALLVYQDESSDEADDMIFNDMPSHSETEDDWNASVISDSDDDDDMEIDENEHRHEETNDENSDMD